MAERLLGKCGFQLDKNTRFPPTETPAVWRYGRSWIPDQPARHLHKSHKQKEIRCIDVTRITSPAGTLTPFNQVSSSSIRYATR